MVRRSLIICVLLLGVMVFAQSLFPKFALDDLRGGEVVLDSILAHNKPVIVTYWATWCKQCIKELRSLKLYHAEQESIYGEPTFYVIALCEDGPRSKRNAIALANKEGWEKFILPYDRGQKIKRKSGVAQIPELFILKPDGTIFYRHIGFNPGNEREIIAKLEELMDELSENDNRGVEKNENSGEQGE